jgi:hypothetical protein
MARRKPAQSPSGGVTRLPYGFSDACDLYQKLQRDAEGVKEARGGPDLADRFFNFAVTAYHLAEWIEKSFPKIPKSDLQDLREQPWFKAVRELANASKHFSLNYPPSAVTAISARYTGTGPAPTKPDVHELSGISVYITEPKTGSETRYSAKEFIDEVLSGYRSFFQARSICQGSL